MRAWITPLALAISICVLSSGAFAQAAVEGALSHALSSGVGTSLGNAMGKATNQMAGRVAQQTSQVAPRQAGVKHPGSTSTAVPSTASQSPNGTPVGTAGNGSMIVSIQGGVRQQAACAAPPQANATTSTSGETPVKPGTVPAQVVDCNKAADPTAFAHPSEITLPAPK